MTELFYEALVDVLEGIAEGKRGRGRERERKHYQLLDDIKIYRSYEKIKRELRTDRHGGEHAKTCLQKQH